MYIKRLNKNFFIRLFLFLCLSIGFSSCTEIEEKPKTPKLVVGIVVDQMRYDYLERFYDYYEEEGFKRLINKGFNFRNTHYNYIPTRTAPGHASLFTGTTPARHGITSNNWYNRATKSSVFSIADTTVYTVGLENSKNTSYSPQNLMASTVNDELKLFHYGKSKVFGFSIKERGAILTAGHAANAAYWLSNGKFVTSSYYQKELPEWLTGFNDKGIAATYLRDGWNLLLDRSEYPEELIDNRHFERSITDQEPEFPYSFPSNDNGAIGSTPFGNSYLTDVAIRCIEAESLGKQEVPDFITISYSATDYIGHRYGAGSLEIMDTYLRLDRDIARLLQKLDESVGMENYVVVLSADHGGMHNAEHLEEQKMNSGFTYKNRLKEKLNTYLRTETGLDELVIRLRDEQVYLDMEKAKTRIEEDKLIALTKQWFLQQKGIRDVVSIKELENGYYHNDEIRGMLKRGVYPKRCGDIIFIHEPGWQSQYLAANHGTAYTYDTHVPMLWYGWKVPQGESARYKTITSIAPTLSMMLRVPLPNAADGRPLIELLDN
ncbi:alkaline phosphatase family protein [Tamlana sp. 2201CG12-4]|uniref:alkaline phosphatase family protein n=1 Tax=Tamlana sp. 2201CG12-4 TaxID=3112582 RepID=UPI002DB59369|nr:alkaline phosphatase family protein [Tamlana sp. 2201CG12-4]MEC3908503.1 alkaline phosphatase family protein [Tamlana sp. 2201CG12-4]